METITIRKRSIWSTVFALTIAAIAYLYVEVIKYLIPGFEQIHELTTKTVIISDMALSVIVIIDYIIIGAFICMLVRTFKTKELKPIKEDGLISSLICGLICGLIIGLVLGIILGFGGAFLIGFILGVLIGLAFGLRFGLINEFKDEDEDKDE
jgi:uncharacterized protein YacL